MTKDTSESEGGWKRPTGGGEIGRELKSGELGLADGAAVEDEVEGERGGEGGKEVLVAVGGDEGGEVTVAEAGSGRFSNISFIFAL